jgi:hypothetical protein
MTTLPLYLADAAPDAMISGNWLIAVIGAIAAGIALVIGKKQGRAEAEENNVTIKHPVPTVPMSKVSTPPTWDAHVALCDRVTRQEVISNELRHDLSEVRKDMEHQYRELLAAGHERERNITDKLDGVARGIHARIDEIMKPKPAR